MFLLDSNPESTYKVSQELCKCLHLKSKRAMGAWTWVSYSNIRCYYDSLVASTSSLPPGVDLLDVLTKLAAADVIEMNQELFLKDKFYRLTKTGRDLYLNNALDSLWGFEAF